MARALPDSTRTPAARVPKFAKSLVGSLQPWSVTVTWQGRVYEIPALPAADWLTAILDSEEGWAAIFPGFLDAAEVREVEGDIIDGGVEDFEDLLVVGKEVLALTAGRDWWMALQLVATVNESWNVVGGEFAIRGIDATRISLAYWLDAALHILLRAMDPKDHTMFLSRLETPPPEALASMPEPEMTAGDFLAFGAD